MAEPITDYDSEAVVRRGEEVYARRVAGTTRPGQEHQYVAIDVESEDFEIDPLGSAAVKRLECRQPNAVIFLCRVGMEPAYEFGGW